MTAWGKQGFISSLNGEYWAAFSSHNHSSQNHICLIYELYLLEPNPNLIGILFQEKFYHLFDFK